MLIKQDLFFKKNSDVQEFNNLCIEAAKQKISIHLAIDNNGDLTIELNKTVKEISIYGQSRYSFTFFEEKNMNNIFSPFLFDIKQLFIPSKDIFYFPNNYRSIADFFARNMAISLVTKNKLYFLKSNEKLSNLNIDISRELIKILFWDYKKYFAKSFPKYNSQKNSLYKFLYFPLIAGCSFEVEILDKHMLQINQLLLQEYKNNYYKNFLNTLLDFRSDILDIKFGVI
jgi:hypothetical protein